MTGRAMHWEPLCAVDPIPGDPVEVGDGGRHYTTMADEIRQQIIRLNNIVSGTLKGAYVQTLNDAADGLQGDLDTIENRYREVGGSLTTWGKELEGFQEEAEVLRQKAETAQAGMDANRVIPMLPGSVLPPPDPEVAAANAKKEGRYDDASRDLRLIQATLADLTHRRDVAARQIAKDIREKSKDTMTDGLWDNFQDWVHGHAALLKKTCTILGYVAMAAVVVCLVVALVVPGLNIVAGTALAALLAGLSTAATVAGVTATAASLAIHTAQYTTGDASLVDIGVDAISLATFGAGRFITTGFKAGKLVGKVLGKGEGFGKQFGGALERLTTKATTLGSEARGGAARAAVQERVTAEVAQARADLARRASDRSWLRRLFHGRRDRAQDAIWIKTQVGDILTRGEEAMGIASQGAKDAYAAKTVTMDPFEQLFLGGGDSGIGASRLTARDAAQGFAAKSEVVQAAAKAEAKGAQAAHLMATSSGATAWSFVMELNRMKWYEDFKASLTREGGHL